MRKILAIVSTFLAVPCPFVATGQEFDHCNYLLEHGITDITRHLSSEHAVAYRWHSNCGIDFSSASDSTVKRASISIFGRGSGGASGNTSQERTRIKSWCDLNRQYAESKSGLVEEARAMSEPALLAWNQCQEIAKKNVKITFVPQGDHSRYVHFEIDSTIDGDLLFYGLTQRNFACEIHMSDNKGTTIDPTSKPLIRNANVQIDCERSAPEIAEAQGVGHIKYPEAYLSINTSGPSLPVAFPQVVEDYFVTPRGAVMAFEAECPAGWGPYDKASGRAIIGAGQGKKLTDRKPGSTGGTEKHQLTVSEMPSHSHDFSGTGFDYGAMDMAQPYTASIAMGKGKVGSKYTPAGSLSSKGDGAAHENMPPWIALRYCIKK